MDLPPPSSTLLSNSSPDEGGVEMRSLDSLSDGRGVVYSNHEYREDCSSVQLSNYLDTDDDGLTMTIDIKPTTGNSGRTDSVTFSQPTKLGLEMDESLNPFPESPVKSPTPPAYYDVVPVERIPPPKPLRTMSVKNLALTESSRTSSRITLSEESRARSLGTFPQGPAPPKAPTQKAPVFTPRKLSDKERVALMQTKRRQSLPTFETELQQALRRVKTRPQIDIDALREQGRNHQPSTTRSSASSLDFDNELKKAITARRSSITASITPKSPTLDLGLTQLVDTDSDSSTAGSGSSTATESCFGSDTRSVMSQPTRVLDRGEMRSRSDSVDLLSNTLQKNFKVRTLGSPISSLSQTELKTIGDFTSTLARLTGSLNETDRAKLTASLSDVQRILGQVSTEKDSGSETELTQIKVGGVGLGVAGLSVVSLAGSVAEMDRIDESDMEADEGDASFNADADVTFVESGSISEAAVPAKSKPEVKPKPRRNAKFLLQTNLRDGSVEESTSLSVASTGNLSTIVHDLDNIVNEIDTWDHGAD